MALIKFFTPQMQHLFEDGIYLKVGCEKELMQARKEHTTHSWSAALFKWYSEICSHSSVELTNMHGMKGMWN